MIFSDRAGRCHPRIIFATLLLTLLATATLRADEFRIALELSDGTQKKIADNAKDAHEVQPPARRASIDAAQDARLTAAWKVTYVGKPPLNDVLVHFYVVKIDRPGQAPPPLVPKNVPLESALTMDFQSNTSTEAKLELRPQESGVYLVRIEAHGVIEPSFVEMEMVVK